MTILNHEHDFQEVPPRHAILSHGAAGMLGLPGAGERVWWVRSKVCATVGCDAALVYPDVSDALEEDPTLWDPVLNRGGQDALAAVEKSIVQGYLLVDFGLLPTR